MKDKKLKPYLLCLFTYFCVGSMVLTGNTVMKPILAQTGWTDSQGAMLVTCLSVGFLLSSLVGNMVMAKIGRRLMCFIGSAIMAVSFLLFAVVGQPVLYYPLLLIAGLAWGGLNSLVNTTVTEMYNGSTSRLNIMNACYSGGAVLFPLLVGFLTAAGMGWQVPVLMVAALGAMLFVFGAMVRLPEGVAAEAAQQKGSSLSFLKELGFYLSFTTFFVYVGTETAASSWLSSYLSQTNTFFAENVPSETMVSLMWGMLLVGRLIFAALGAKIDRRVLLVVQTAGFLLGLGGVILFSASTPLAILFVIVMGLSMSAMYATAVSNASAYLTGSPIAAGIIFGGGGLGSSVLPLVAGMVSDAINLKAGMTSLCFFLVLLLAASIVNLKTAKKA